MHAICANKYVNSNRRRSIRNIKRCACKINHAMPWHYDCVSFDFDPAHALLEFMISFDHT